MIVYVQKSIACQLESKERNTALSFTTLPSFTIICAGCFEPLVLG